MSGARKGHREDLQAVQSSGPVLNTAGGAAPQPPATAAIQARHGNSAVAQAALAGSNGPPAAGPNDRGGGLPAGVRDSMEAAFGRSFSEVRMSEGERVRPGQLALTEGRNIDFAPGHFKPETPAGRFLLAHELTHVVQQQNGGGAATLAKSEGSRAPARPDLENEANAVASHIAGGGAGTVQVLGRVAPGEPVTLAFEAREHVLIAWKKYKGWVQMGQFYIPWAFTVAMADLFENMWQAQDIAEKDPEQFEAVLALQVAQPVPGRETQDDKKKQGKTEPASIASEEPVEELAIHKEIGTDKTEYHPKLREAYGEIDELLKIAAVDPGQFRYKSPKAAAAGPGEFRGQPPKPGKRKTEDDFSGRVKKALKERFYKLAKFNLEHYLNPDGDDLNLSLPEKIKLGLTKNEEGKKLNPNLAGTYHENHEKAIWEAVEAGATRKGLDRALLFEGWAIHFLEDSFAGGHLRTARRSAEKLWDEKAPLFYDNMKGYVAEQLSKELDFLAPSARLAVIRLVLNWVFEDLPKLGAGLALSVGLQHDEDNKRGVKVRIGGKIVRLMGDATLNQETESYAAEAVQMSFQEVKRAYGMGAEGSGDLNVRFNHVVDTLKKDGLYAAEHLIPTEIIPDEELAPADKSLPWQNLNDKALFKNAIFQEGAARFLKLKIANFSGVLAGLPGVVKDEFKVKAALEKTILWQMKAEPVKMLRRILDWTPTLGGRAGAVDYLRDVVKSGDTGSLTEAQRWKLVEALLSEWMTKEEAHLLRSLLLTAPADEVRAIIRRFGYDHLAKTLGSKFVELVRDLPAQ